MHSTIGRFHVWNMNVCIYYGHVNRAISITPTFSYKLQALMQVETYVIYSKPMATEHLENYYFDLH